MWWGHAIAIGGLCGAFCACIWAVIVIVLMSPMCRDTDRERERERESFERVLWECEFLLTDWGVMGAGMRTYGHAVLYLRWCIVFFKLER